MSDQLYPQEYRCNCGLASKHYVWSSKLLKEKPKCPCGAQMTYKNAVIKKPAQLTAIRTPTKNR